MSLLLQQPDAGYLLGAWMALKGMKTLERWQASPFCTNNAVKEEYYSLVIPHHDHASFVARMSPLNIWDNWQFDPVDTFYYYIYLIGNYSVIMGTCICVSTQLSQCFPSLLVMLCVARSVTITKPQITLISVWHPSILVPSLHISYSHLSYSFCMIDSFCVI